MEKITQIYTVLSIPYDSRRRLYSDKSYSDFQSAKDVWHQMLFSTQFDSVRVWFLYTILHAKPEVTTVRVKTGAFLSRAA